MIYPPVELTVNQLLNEPDTYLGKLVKTSGSIQFIDTDKETFDLRVADFAVQIQYAGIPPTAKTTIAADRTAAVVGILRRDENLNAVYIVAQRLEVR